MYFLRGNGELEGEESPEKGEANISCIQGKRESPNHNLHQLYGSELRGSWQLLKQSNK